MSDDWTPDEYDPVADIKAMRERMNKPDTEYWERRAKMEKALDWATNQLIESGMTPEEIVTLYVRYGIWPR